MPAETEQSYVEQGYRLPDRLTWDMVADRRAVWGINPIFVPIAVVPGSIAWGVPHVEGRPLRHP